MAHGVRLEGPSLEESRAWHLGALAELAHGETLTLVRV
jgi:hypothetical protein